VEMEAFKKNIEQAGLELTFLGPKDAGPWMKAQHEANKALTAKLGLTPE
jgi:hypothetical protein